MARRDAILHLPRQRRRDRANLSAFRALIASPHDLGTGPLIMPAPGRLALSHSAGLSAGQVAVSVGTHRSFSHPALAADEVHRGIHGEDGFRVSQTGTPSGTFSLFLVEPFDANYWFIAGQTLI